jgi:molybdopterin-containing oxidoreductase family iron-sulfur binding subunit
MGDGQQAKSLVTRVSRSYTRVSWDNYVTVSNADAKALG